MDREEGREALQKITNPRVGQIDVSGFSFYHAPFGAALCQPGPSSAKPGAVIS
jgi:hypothetical protein